MRSVTVAGKFRIFIDLEVVVLQGVFMTEVYCLSALYQMSSDGFSPYL